MTWATHHIARLRQGQTVQFRPRGNSMSGRIESGQLVTVEPVTDPAALKVNDVVLCSVEGHHYLHLIRAIGADRRFQIANNRGRINGWVTATSVHGRCVKVEK
jgi:hypothetical protein